MTVNTVIYFLILLFAMYLMNVFFFKEGGSHCMVNIPNNRKMKLESLGAHYMLEYTLYTI